MEQGSIPCQICSRVATVQRPFFCQQCARSRLYESRLHHAQTLLDKESLEREVEDAFRSSKHKHEDDAPQSPVSQVLAQDALAARLNESKRAASDMSHANEDMTREVQRLREMVLERRRTLQKREQALEKRKEAVSARGLRAFDPIPGVTRKVETEWIRLHSAISEDRMLLCTEAANLYGLELKRRTRDSRMKDMYYLGDVPVVDLRELNSASPELVTVSLGRIAHLLHLSSHYLSLQLPAEITLPSSGNPFTLIHSPLSSYKDPTLPTGQRHAAAAPKSTRQRVLRLDKPLPHLAAEDQLAYSLFVDGVTLLAWNIAWLAKTQGIEVGVKHWDEVCAMGRNLWLLFGPLARIQNKALSPTRATSYDSSSPQSTPTSTPMARTPSGGNATTKRPASLQAAAAGPITPGRLSHNSAFAFLPAATMMGGSAELFRAWQFANPVRLIERIKAALANERMGAEWEVLEREEWEGHMVDDTSGATTPLVTAPDGALTSAARMRGLLTGRAAPPIESSGNANESGDDDRPSAAQRQRRGWLRVRSQGEGTT